MGAKIVKELIQQALDHPEEFELTAYYWIHKPSNIYIWIANGTRFVEAKKCGGFGYMDKRRLYKAFVAWKNNTSLAKFIEEEQKKRGGQSR